MYRTEFKWNGTWLNPDGSIQRVWEGVKHQQRICSHCGKMFHEHEKKMIVEWDLPTAHYLCPRPTEKIRTCCDVLSH